MKLIKIGDKFELHKSNQLNELAQSDCQDVTVYGDIAEIVDYWEHRHFMEQVAQQYAMHSNDCEAIAKENQDLNLENDRLRLLVNDFERQLEEAKAAQKKPNLILRTIASFGLDVLVKKVSGKLK